MSSNKKELNPFEDPNVAKEWINSVENEKGLIRDNDIYPFLRKWVNELKPKTIIEIGSGQGICSEKIDTNDFISYIGVEPSVYLVERAKELYTNDSKKFLVGNAYELPVDSGIADAVFSINVWFHLEDLNRASSELSRILKRGGKFLIITANPNGYVIWESFHFDYRKNGKTIIGKVRVPINPMSSAIFHEHSIENITKNLELNGLKINKINELGSTDKDEQKLFISIVGEK